MTTDQSTTTSSPAAGYVTITVVSRSEAAPDIDGQAAEAVSPGPRVG